MHTIIGLKSASWASQSPWPHPLRGHTRAQKAGLFFQRQAEIAFRKALGSSSILAGPWLSFEDSSGRGFAQPDLLLFPQEERIILLEIKYTYTPDAWPQLLSLYLPLLSYLLPSREIIPTLLCKKLIPGIDDVLPLSTLQTKEDFFPQMTLLWDGKTKLSLGERAKSPRAQSPLPSSSLGELLWA